MCVCMCGCVRMCVCVCACVYACVVVSVCITYIRWVCAFVCVCVRTCAYEDVCACVCVCMSYLRTRMLEGWLALCVFDVYLVFWACLGLLGSQDTNYQTHTVQANLECIWVGQNSTPTATHQTHTVQANLECIWVGQNSTPTDTHQTHTRCKPTLNASGLGSTAHPQMHIKRTHGASQP
jgi:hypothetical protein